MKKFFAKFLLFLIVLTLPASVFAKTITTTGMGGSERTALKDAMRIAIEEALGAEVSSETITENYTVIKDRIKLYSEGYITKYEILEKSKENGLYKLTIKADVRDDISNIILSDKEKRAKVKFGLNDPRIAVASSDSSVQNAFIEGLKNIGFSRIVNSANNADFIVTVNIKEHKTGLAGANFTVSAKITNKKTGEVIFAGSEDKKGVGSAQRSKAIKKAAEKILKQIDLTTMELASKPEHHITIIITKPNSNLTALKNKLIELSGASNVYLRNKNSNFVEFDIDSNYDETELAEILEERGIKILSIGKNIIKI